MNQTEKLVEALNKIADIDCDSPARYCVNIAQQALESYKDGWVGDNRDRCSIGLHFPIMDGTCLVCGNPLPSPPQTKTI